MWSFTRGQETGERRWRAIGELYRGHKRGIVVPKEPVSGFGRAAFPADNREVAYHIQILLSTRFTYIEFDVFQCTVKDLVQSLTVDSNTVSKHMSRTSVRHDVILAKDTPRMVADAARRPADAERDE